MNKKQLYQNKLGGLNTKKPENVLGETPEVEDTIEQENNNTETNKSSFADTLKNAASELGNNTSAYAQKIGENISNTYNSIENNQMSKWKDYSALISDKTSNSKAELQSALQRANAGTQRYLEALGLQGSGLGQSQLGDIGTQYMNAMANINSNAENQVNNELSTQYSNMLNNGASDEELNQFTKKYGEATGSGETWNTTRDAYRNEQFNNDKTTMSGVLDSLIQNGTDSDGNELSSANQKIAKQIRNELYNASNEQEYKSIAEKYADFLNDPSGYVDENDNSLKLENNYSGEKWTYSSNQIKDDVASGKLGKGTSVDDLTTDYFTGKNGDKMVDHGKEGTKQDNFEKAILQAAKDGKIPNGTAIDINVGGGTSQYIYYDGKFYKTTSNGYKTLGHGDSKTWEKLGITY